MDGDDLSDDVFLDRQVINRDELRIADGQIPTIPLSKGAKVGGAVAQDEEEVRIFAPLDYDEGFTANRHENYFYPDDAPVSEGWKSYKIEDEEPFGPLNGPLEALKSNNNNNNHPSMYYNPNANAAADTSQQRTKPDFDASVTHKVRPHRMLCPPEAILIHASSSSSSCTGHNAGRLWSGQDVLPGALPDGRVQGRLVLCHRGSCLNRKWDVLLSCL